MYTIGEPDKSNEQLTFVKRKSSSYYSSTARSPTMVGCAFAMRRDYFFQLGGLDEGMDIWGAENIELPLRVSHSFIINMDCNNRCCNVRFEARL
jgi:GT2 family glycosyltransferase